MMTVLLALLGVTVVFFLGRTSVRRPVVALPAPPARKRFGLAQAEEVKRQLGGLSREQANATRVAAAVVGMDFIVAEDVAATRESLESSVQGNERNIRICEVQIVQAREAIDLCRARDAEVVSVAAALCL